MKNTNEILFDEIPGENGNVGLITLNRPSRFNALNLVMIQMLYDQLKTWALANHIKAVIVQAVPGPAFCSGADLLMMYECAKSNHPDKAIFFRDEYEMIRLIYRYPKPYITLMDGITMGGGVGLSLYGSHRVVTGKLIFAMPETKIGFFPDVGGSYFLSRLSGNIGFYLGLTGASIGCDDCMALGIASNKVASSSFPDIVNSIAQHPFTSDSEKSVSEIISQFSIAERPSRLLEQQAEINRCFSRDSVEEIIESLQSSTDPFCQESAKNLLTKSPTSLKVTFQALQRGAQLDFDTCIFQDYRIVNQFLDSYDFPEGIKAIMIDKNNKPKWNPDTLSTVTINDVNNYFSPLSKELYER